MGIVHRHLNACIDFFTSFFVFGICVSYVCTHTSMKFVFVMHNKRERKSETTTTWIHLISHLIHKESCFAATMARRNALIHNAPHNYANARYTIYIMHIFRERRKTNYDDYTQCALLCHTHSFIQNLYRNHSDLTICISRGSAVPLLAHMYMHSMHLQCKTYYLRNFRICDSDPTQNGDYVHVVSRAELSGIHV